MLKLLFDSFHYILQVYVLKPYTVDSEFLAVMSKCLVVHRNLGFFVLTGKDCSSDSNNMPAHTGSIKVLCRSTTSHTQELGVIIPECQQ